MRQQSNSTDREKGRLTVPVRHVKVLNGRIYTPGKDYQRRRDGSSMCIVFTYLHILGLLESIQLKQGIKMAKDIHISDNLRALIVGRDVSRTDLCEQVGLSESALSNYLNGRIPQSWEPIVALANFFDVSLDYLVTGREHSRGSAHRDIEHLLQHHATEMEQRVEGQNDLFLRVVESFMKNTRATVNSAIKHNRSFNTSILNEEQIWTLERCADEVTIATPYMKNEVIYDPDLDELKPGRYFNYITRCIELNPDIRYHFVVNGEPLLPKTIEQRFLALLHENGVQLDEGNVRITVTNSPVYTQIVVYRLNESRVKAINETLYQRIQPFTGDNQELGIVLAPSDQAQLNILMDNKNLQVAKAFLRSIRTAKNRRK